MEELIEVMAVSVNSCTENTGKYVSNQNLCLIIRTHCFTEIAQKMKRTIHIIVY